MNKQIENILRNDMDEAVMPAIEKAMEAGATWKWDPEFNDVAGLFSADGETLVIVYIRERDAEIGDKFEERYM